MTRVAIRNALHPFTLAGAALAIALPAAIAVAGNPLLGSERSRHAVAWLDLHLAFWVFSAQALLALALVLPLFSDLLGFLKGIIPGRRWIAAMTLISLTTAAAAAGWVEGRHRVQSDESGLLATAQNLYHRRISAACDEGEFTRDGLECHKDTGNFKGRGFSYLLALGMPLFGRDLHWVFSFQLALYVLTGWAYFLALQAWVGGGLVPLVATAALLVQPMVIFQFRSGSAEPLHVLLSALCLLHLRWALARDTLRHWVLLALGAAFLAQTRQETVFSLGAFILPALPRLMARRDQRLTIFLLLLALFSVPILLTISRFQGFDFQGGAYPAHGHFLENLATNWRVMSATPLDADGRLGAPFLSWFAWLALAGLAVLVVRAFRESGARRWLLFLALYHVQAYVLLENVVSDFTIEINQRYAMVFFPTMAFFTALAVEGALMRLPAFLCRRGPVRLAPPCAFTVAAAACAVLAAPTLRHRDSLAANVMYRRNHLTGEEAEILRWVRQRPERARLFVYARPWHFIGYGMSALHYDRVKAMNATELDALVRHYGGEVYYVRGLDCWDEETWHPKAVESRITESCDEIERSFRIAPVHRAAVTSGNGVAISRLLSRKSFDPSRLLALSLFHHDGNLRTAQVGYRLEGASVADWRVEIMVNDELQMARPFAAAEYLETLHEPPVHAGENILTVRVMDREGAELARREMRMRIPYAIGLAGKPAPHAAREVPGPSY